MEQYGAMRVVVNPIFKYPIMWVDTSVENWWDNDEIVRIIHMYDNVNIEYVKSWGKNDSGKCISCPSVGATCFARADHLSTVIHEIFHAVNDMFDNIDGEDSGSLEITAYTLDWTIGELLEDFKLTPRTESKPDTDTCTD